MEKITRDTIWGTLDGRRIPIRCLGDAHLANVIHHVGCGGHFNGPLFAVLLKEANDRGLTEEFLGRAPIPFQDVDGKWKTLKGNEYKVIGR